CAAFVCWVLGQAGVVNPKTGWSPGLFGTKRVIWTRDGRSSCVLCVVSYEGNFGVVSVCRDHQPNSGDVFGLYFPEKGRIAHVGFVDEWDGTWAVTVEGNTNES